jgi:hypothetical protein
MSTINELRTNVIHLREIYNNQSGEWSQAYNRYQALSARAGASGNSRDEERAADFYNEDVLPLARVVERAKLAFENANRELLAAIRQEAESQLALEAATRVVADLSRDA